MAQKKPSLGFVENFALSGAAAVISKTAAAPIERIKLLVQNQDEMIKAGRLSEPYKGVIDCTMKTFKSEGLLPFWRGNLANCLRYFHGHSFTRYVETVIHAGWAWSILSTFATQALNFAFKDTIKAMFKADPKESYASKFTKNIFSGGAAGAMSLCFVYSLDYARTRLANDAKGKGGGERQFNGLIDVYRKTLASDGIVGLYRGFVISCVGIVVYRGFYFGLYDSLKPIILGDNSGLFLNFILGYTVTVSSGLLSYPIDTIRRRMMMTSGQAVKYKGSIDCGVQIIKNEGFMSLMKGAGANILRGVAGAGVLSGFDEFKKVYIAWRTAQ